jgi:putative lipoprotein
MAGPIGHASRILAALVAAAGLAAGCRSSQPPAASTPPRLAASAFDCEGGPGFVLARTDGDADDAVDLILPDRRYRLPRVRTASGVRYAAGGVGVWTKGREAMLELEGRVSRCVENRRRSILEDARARGVQFRASGNEPGWTWELLADRMVFVGAYGAQRVTAPRPPGQRGSTTGETTYDAVTEAHRMTVRIRPGLCLDTMSGDRHGAAVEVDVDGTVHRGCGDATGR